MKEIFVLGAKDSADLIEKLKAALQTCNLCEENLERYGGYMCDAENFSITGQEYLPIFCRFGIKN